MEKNNKWRLRQHLYLSLDDSSITQNRNQGKSREWHTQHSLYIYLPSGQRGPQRRPLQGGRLRQGWWLGSAGSPALPPPSPPTGTFSPAAFWEGETRRARGEVLHDFETQTDGQREGNARRGTGLDREQRMRIWRRRRKNE